MLLKIEVADLANRAENEILATFFTNSTISSISIE